MTMPEQGGCATEMALKKDIAAQKLIFLVRKEALRQFQNQLIALRKEKKPSTNAFAIRALLLACRSERFCIDFAFAQIEQDERLIEEVHRTIASATFSMPEETTR
ncbi:hypothetical protein LA374_00395 [Aeromonas schubertii]|uniref:Uncharacterized protein n=1 Tax=Aeromonas schubertii TaxID=652 RepID=A0ABS7V5M6_9GAMM|nr:hypothetical protein [Aeromonas schubertii]MBZ6064677.1 hypothetical protein [Aeromonas schubertii]